MDFRVMATDKPSTEHERMVAGALASRMQEAIQELGAALAQDGTTNLIEGSGESIDNRINDERKKIDDESDECD